MSQHDSPFVSPPPRSKRAATNFSEGVLVLACGCSLMEGRCSRHLPMMKAIREAWDEGRCDSNIWALQDGYGMPGYVPPQGFDWSAIRDSSPEAIEAMFEAVSR